MSSEGHQLHQVQFEGAVEPAGAFAIESRPAPDGVTLMALSGELDIAATSELRACVDRAAGSRGLVLDLAGATFVDSSMLKELLRASFEALSPGARPWSEGAADAEAPRDDDESSESPSLG